MNVTVNGTIASFLLAVLVYWLFEKVIDTLIKNPQSREVFHVVLLIICIVIAFGGTLFLHL